MLRLILNVSRALGVIGLAVLLTSCSTMSLGPAPNPNVEVKIGGTPTHFAAFDKALQSIIGSEPLGCSVKIGGTVSPCSALQTSPVPPNATDLTYEFFGGHTFVFDKFGTAFDQVAKQFNPNLPTMTVQPISTPSPDCGPPKPQPCVAAPYCVQYGRCSKSQFPCQMC
jgi:hypothetical protein